MALTATTTPAAITIALSIFKHMYVLELATNSYLAIEFYSVNTFISTHKNTPKRQKRDTHYTHEPNTYPM